MKETSQVRTPKYGEHWVWKECDKHGYRQLRDLVIVGRDFEDQPDWIQGKILEHVRCGCQYPADDPIQALADLRRDEAKHEAEVLAQFAQISELPRRERPFPWLLAALLGMIFIWMALTASR